MNDRTFNAYTLIGAILGCLLLIMLASCYRVAHAEYEPNVIHCILGEARGESPRGMRAVGEAIRNRGTLKGVYGCKFKFKETNNFKELLRQKHLEDEARHQWYLSKSSNLVNGATHWESTDFKKPWWAKDMIRTATIGKHVFYKEK